MFRSIKRTFASLHVVYGPGFYTDAQHITSNAFLANASSKVTVGWSIGSAAFGLVTSYQFWSFIVGLIGVLGGLAITWHFNSRRDKRERELHAALMRANQFAPTRISRVDERLHDEPRKLDE